MTDVIMELKDSTVNADQSGFDGELENLNSQPTSEKESAVVLCNEEVGDKEQTSQTEYMAIANCSPEIKDVSCCDAIDNDSGKNGKKCYLIKLRRNNIVLLSNFFR